MGRFSEGSSGASGFNNFIAEYWHQNKCYFVSWETEYSVFDSMDYKRCVCNKWDAGNETCLDAPEYVPDPDDDSSDPTQNDDDNTDPTPNDGGDVCGTVDGIWTGIDWVDTTNQYKVINGIVEGTTPETQRRITSARNLPGDGSNYLSLDNVIRVQSILPESLWNSFFPQALPVYTYDNFLKAVAKFPKFCNDPSAVDPDLENSCRVELSTFLAQMKHESGSL